MPRIYILLPLFLLFLSTPTLASNAQLYTPEQRTRACQSITRDELIDCFRTYIDTNHDDILSIAEIKSALATYYPKLSFQKLFTHCDATHDGQLTLTDWNEATNCLNNRFDQYKACDVCISAGWTVPKVN